MHIKKEQNKYLEINVGEKMKLNQLKIGVILTYISQSLSLVISFVYTPIMLSILTQSEYGVYSLVSSVIANLSILSFGFSSSYVKYYSKYKVTNDKEGMARLNGMFLIIYSIIAIMAFVCGIILIQNAEVIFKNGLSFDEIGTAKILMFILVINISISFPASIFVSYIIANERYIFLRLVNLVKTIFSPFLTIAMLLMGYGTVGMVVITLLLNIIVDIFNVIYSFNKLEMQFIFQKMNFKLLKEIWIFSFYIFLNIITDQINWNVDKFILGIFKGSVAVAIYGVAVQLYNYYIQFAYSISNVFIPRVNALVAANESNATLTRLFVKIGRIQFIILSLVLLIYIFWGKYFICFWAGEEYIEAYYICLILLLSISIELIQIIGLEIQRAKNLHKFRAILCIIMAVLNIAISIPLCKVYGAIGASIGTALSFIIGNGLIINIYYKKKIGLDVGCFWLNILKIFPGMLPAITYGIFSNYYLPVETFISFVVEVTFMFIIYAIGIWLFSMNSYEKKLILSPMKKLFKLNEEK